jgi:ABC-type sugar transport system permease subunit
VFWHSFGNVWRLLFSQYLVGGPLALLLALALSYKSSKLKSIFKTVAFLPSILSVTVICLLWKMIYKVDHGLLDSFLYLIGLESLIKTWLVDPEVVNWSIVVVTVWQYIGFNMILFYAGIKSIPETLYEAAKVEGANFIQVSLKITIPLIQEIIKFVLMMITAGTMGTFAHIQILTNGGPGDISRSVIFHLYYKAFQLLDFGSANSITVVFAIQGFFLFAMISRFIARNRIEYT